MQGQQQQQQLQHQLQQQQQQQHQQQPQPQVVVVQQPIVINGRMRRASPYMLRGYQFPDGRKLPGGCFILLLCFGIGLLFPGLINFFMAFSISDAAGLNGYFFTISFCFLFVGGLLFGPGLYYCRKARQQYDELPQDHPDRHKFGSGFVLPDIPCNIAVPANNTHTTYNFTPGVQGPAGGSASFQGYPSASAPNLQGSPGANTYYPQGPPGSKSSSQMPPATNPYYHGHPEGYPGQTGPSQSYPPPSSSAAYSGQPRDTYPTAAKDDLPPSYSDIEVNKCQ